MNKMTTTKFAAFSWGVLGFNILIILWGAYVRVTGSGAGCGSHWPLCNGVIIPNSPGIETTIEFIHRIMSGFGLIFVFSMLLWSLKLFPKSHPVRRGAWLASFFIIMEAFVGALLVLFKLVAKDDSVARAVFIAIHLVNTFLLLASLALVSWWASGMADLGPIKKEFKTWVFLIAFLSVILIGMSGAITALGDTLFPVQSISEGLQQDLANTAHFLIRLRVWHPILAILSGIFIVSLVRVEGLGNSDGILNRLSWILGALFIAQLSIGVLNLFLLAPAYMQLIHLFLADMVWIFLVLYAAHYYRQREAGISD